MKVELYNTVIHPRECYCSLCDLECSSVEAPYMNMYIKFSGCNAKCKFCMDDCKKKPFDIEKLKDIMSYLKSNIAIRKISLTGGEPTLDISLLEEVYSIATDSFPDAVKVINTNGFNLIGLFDSKVLKSVDSVSLSRHHYLDRCNAVLFGSAHFNKSKQVKVPSWQGICKIEKDNSGKLHLSCNLIKGNIDSPYEIRAYLDFANRIGIYDVGFVSLMPLNEYCIDRKVEFDGKGVIGLTETKSWKYEDSCECHNYLYLPDDFRGQAVKVYHRNPKKPFDFESLLVYDGDKLRLGFNGKVLT